MTLRPIGHLGPSIWMYSRCSLKVTCFTLGYLALFINLFKTIGITFMAFVFCGVTQSNETWVSEPGEGEVDADQLEGVEVYVLLVIGVVLLLHLAWLGWNLFIIIRLHKRQPGPIELHMTMASIQLVLLVLALWKCIARSNYNKPLTSFTSTEICVTGCYLIAYHAYATRLKHGLNARILAIETASPTEVSATDVYFAYPKNMDKQNLVKNEKYYH